MYVFNFIKSRFRTMYIMSSSVKDIPKVNRNALSFSLINSANVSDFNSCDIVEIERLLKRDGMYVGAYKDGIPVALGGIVVKNNNNRTSYFILKKSDLSLVTLWVSEEYRGRGIMGDMISYLVNTYGSPDCIVSLGVDIHNNSAIKCYSKNGFKIIKKCRFIHIRWPYDFPKYSI